jgi:acetyltransferase-like isoleucine patch superfamily enzyme
LEAGKRIGERIDAPTDPILADKVMATARKSILANIIRRFLVPRFIVSLYYYVKFGAKISPRAEVELSSNLTLGHNCIVSSFTKIKAADGPLTIGNRCGFGTGCFISSGEKGLVIGDNLVCGPNVVIMASSYRYESLDVHLHNQGVTSKGTRIGNNVWIGAGSVVLDGSDIGENSIIVANSLVSRHHPQGSVLQGSPAKPMRSFHRS